MCLKFGNILVICAPCRVVLLLLEQRTQRRLDRINRARLTEVQPRVVHHRRVPGLDLRTVEHGDGMVVPGLVEGAARLRDQADAEEAIDSLEDLAEYMT